MYAEPLLQIIIKGAMDAMQVHDLLPSAQMVKIPMRQKHVRSLNLSVSVGIGVFEAIRQLDGPNFTADQ